MENTNQTTHQTTGQTESGSKGGLHKIGEAVRNAVTHETVKPHQHENVTTAVDRDVHQHHYHTSVQPVQDQQVLPEKHVHNTAAVQHKEFHHGNEQDHHAKLNQAAAQFKDERHVAPTHETRTIAPTQTKEQVHHHVHETIQPVVHRETIQPHVVHTTVPVHEVHHNAPKHHETSTLPTMTMGDFQKQGGTLTGHEERTTSHVPAGIRDVVGGATTGTHQHGHSHEHGHGHSHTAGQTAGVQTGTHQHGVGHEHGHSHTHGAGQTTGAQTGTLGSSNAGPGTINTTGVGSHDKSHTGVHDSTSTEPQKKTGLLAKLDPRVDADGDGKAGIFS